MKIIRLLSSEDAVSEVVDFVTIIGILVVSIGIIGVAGYPILKNAQEKNYIENTRQSFTVLAENLNKVVVGQAPSQSVELKLYGGSLSVTGNSTIKINATRYNSTNSSNEEINLVDQQMRSIESTIGETTIAYEGTGVWAKYPNGNTLTVNKPLITNQSNVLVIPAVKLSGTSSTGGSGMSHVSAKGVPTVAYYGNVSNITIRITGDYTDGWKRYFEKIMSWSIQISGGSSSELIAQLNTTNIDIYILNIQLDAEVE